MFKFTTIIMISFIFFRVESVQSSVDYSKCMDLINGPMGQMTGYVPGLGMLPIKLGSDGKIKTIGPDVNYKVENQQEIVEFNVPSFSYPTTDRVTGEMIMGKPVNRKVSAIIERDEAGNLKQIRLENPLTQAEINQQIELNRATRDRFMSEEAKKAFLEMSGEENLPDPFLGHNNAQIFNFSVRNNTCVAEEALTEVLVEPKVGGKTTLVPTMNTELCRDLNQFFKNHPEAQACFNRQLNNRVDSIFSKYRGKYSSEEFTPAVGGFGMGMGMAPGGYGMGMGGFGMIGGSPLVGSLYSLNSTLAGSSSVINANRLIDLCQLQQLSPFFEDDTIWAEASNGSRVLPGAAIERK